MHVRVKGPSWSGRDRQGERIKLNKGRRRGGRGQDEKKSVRSEMEEDKTRKGQEEEEVIRRKES